MFLEEKRVGEVPVNLEPWRQLLLDAADLMEKRGHVKSMLENKTTGAVCFHGALNYIQSGRKSTNYGNVLAYDPDYIAWHQANQSMETYAKRFGEASVVAWNNNPFRTGEEVIAGMRDCAKNFRA